jgi:hypothetical protein
MDVVRASRVKLSVELALDSLHLSESKGRVQARTGPFASGADWVVTDTDLLPVLGRARPLVLE